MYRLMVKTGFAAAHQLRGYQGKCEALHGHNWRIEFLVIVKEVNELGLGMDFKEMKRRLRAIVQVLDHTNLNDLPPFMNQNPSSENIARYIFEQAVEEFKRLGVQVDLVRVWESEDAYAEYWP